MSLSLDDKILGEKVHNYCSSEDESGDEDDKKSDSEAESKSETMTTQLDVSNSQPSFNKYPGYCTNTGPKGVINDWREFKRLENARRDENELQKMALAKKLSITCSSYLNDDERKAEQDDRETEECDSDEEFLQVYRLKRLEEMKKAVQTVPTYGHVVHLDTHNYVEAIDQESPTVTVLVHIYNEGIKACNAMNGCFKCLAKHYPGVKFCEISATDANLSTRFAFDGVPAILVYRNKQLVGNFIRLAKDFGDDFYATEIESFLHEHGMLPFNDLKHSSIRDGPAADDLDDSDFEVD